MNWFKRLFTRKQSEVEDSKLQLDIKQIDWNEAMKPSRERSRKLEHFFKRDAELRGFAHEVQLGEVSEV